MNEAMEGATSVGARLRAAREEQGQTVDDIGRATRVPVRHLVQIEAGQLEGLPAVPYSAGFVKSYARVVGLDPVALGRAFRAEFDTAQRGSGRIAYEPYEPADPSRLPPRLLALVALAIAILLISGYAIWRSGVLTGEGPNARARLAANGDESIKHPCCVDGPPALTPSQEQSVNGRPTPTGGLVVLTATQPTWVKITERSGPVLFQGTLDKGKAYQVPATAIDPVIRTGKPEGIAVTVGGRTVAPLGEPAHVVADVSLKGASLAARGGGAASSPVPVPASIPTIDAAPPATNVPRAFANSVGR